MRVVAVVLLVIGAVVAVLAILGAIAFGREYGTATFWESIVWGILFTLVPLVPGIWLLRRSRKG